MNVNPFSVQIIKDEFSANQSVFTGKTRNLFDGIIVKDFPGYVEVLVKGNPFGVTVIKNNPRQYMEPKIKVVQVVWMACGEQSAENANLYAKAIMSASKIGKEIDRLKKSVEIGG